MKTATRIITLIALLIIGLFIGYLWNDYKQTQRENPQLVPIEETLIVTGTDTLTGSDNDNDETQTGSTLEDDNSELTGEDTIAYQPLLVNDNDTTSDITKYPEFDTTFSPELDNESGSAPHIQRTNETQETLTERFKLKGKVTTDVERIDIIRDGDMTPFTLKKFTPGTTDFEYNMNPEYDNLNEGTNYYLIRAYAKDNLYQKIIEVEYQSAPSAEDFDDAFKSE